MKQKLIKLLCTGCIETKKYNVMDFHKKFGFTTLIIKNAENNCISCNNNAFWKYENNEKRNELIKDLMGVKRCNVNDPAYFHILNRIENGDKYGMECAKPGVEQEKHNNCTILQKVKEINKDIEIDKLYIAFLLSDLNRAILDGDDFITDELVETISELYTKHFIVDIRDLVYAVNYVLETNFNNDVNKFCQVFQQGDFEKQNETLDYISEKLQEF